MPSQLASVPLKIRLTSRPNGQCPKSDEFPTLPYVISSAAGVTLITALLNLKGIYPEFQVIRGLSQKIPADLLSYDKIQC